MAKKKEKKVKPLGKEKDGESFEKLYAAVSMALHPGETVEHNIKKRQSSGVNRQIDVAIGDRRIIVECKDKNRNVQLTEMDAFIRLCQTTNSEGIFVSKKGFASNALKNAAEAGIKTFTLSQIEAPEFLINFIPEVGTLRFYTNLVNMGFEISREYEAVGDVTHCQRWDGEEVPVTWFAEYLRNKLLDGYNFEFFKPQLADLLKSEKKKEISIKKVTPLRFELPPEMLQLKNKGNLIPIAYFSIVLEHWVGFEPREKKVYQQKSTENPDEIVTQTVVTELTHNDKPYSLGIVDTGTPGPLNLTLIPKYRSSELVKLEVLGKLF